VIITGCARYISGQGFSDLFCTRCGLRMEMLRDLGLQPFCNKDPLLLLPCRFAIWFRTESLWTKKAIHFRNLPSVDLKLEGPFSFLVSRVRTRRPSLSPCRRTKWPRYDGNFSKYLYTFLSDCCKSICGFRCRSPLSSLLLEELHIASLFLCCAKNELKYLIQLLFSSVMTEPSSSEVEDGRLRWFPEDKCTPLPLVVPAWRCSELKEVQSKYLSN
jgi:hypothetical protein